VCAVVSSSRGSARSRRRAPGTAPAEQRAAWAGIPPHVPVCRSCAGSGTPLLEPGATITRAALRRAGHVTTVPRSNSVHLVRPSRRSMRPGDGGGRTGRTLRRDSPRPPPTPLTPAPRQHRRRGEAEKNQLAPASTPSVLHSARHSPPRGFGRPGVVRPRGTEHRKHGQSAGSRPTGYGRPSPSEGDW